MTAEPLTTTTPAQAEPGPLAAAELAVIEHRRRYLTMWRGKDDLYWMARLTEELGELSGALLGRHEHSPEIELRQIAGICINWLEYRASRQSVGADDGR